LRVFMNAGRETGKPFITQTHLIQNSREGCGHRVNTALY
jgi:hypothetical protein